MEMSNQAEKRSLNLFDIFNLGFGGAVGSGIFILMGSGIEATGKSIVLAVAVGCVFMLLAYFYNILLSSMFCFGGGDYSQKAIVFNPFFTGMGGYITFINGFAVAMYSVAMIEYASIVFPNILQFKTIISLIVITLFFAATMRGSKFISTINSIMTVVLYKLYIYIYNSWSSKGTAWIFFKYTIFQKWSMWIYKRNCNNGLGLSRHNYGTSIRICSY